ncbi:ROK family protein [Frigoribacterium faeni]|uniref:Glucokinase n=1 Tax=Frigoribacterium faeni TaxID=145483 RepID=A0A7W3JFF2_9MICO|nr:ROK family protein [Frigoribacterium faeni]MBA8811837.1 glucokinase [Frigoribacterium faeni]GEK84781.1 sugar kinase [Frigoribacterium faeni]
MSGFALAVDLGGTKVEAALVDASGRIADGSRVRAATGAASHRADLRAAVGTVVDGALAALPAGGELRGAGIGSAGPVDLVAGTVSPKNLPVLAGFDLRSDVQDRLPGLPVRLRLDGTCIALAEHWLGATAGLADSMSMVVSTGVGGGLIVGGALVSGRTGNAGHIGQIHVAGFGGTAGDVDSTTLEAVASGTSSVSWARGHGWVGTSGEELALSCADGEPTAWAAVHRSAAAVGQAIASTTTLLDLDVVAIGGGFAGVVPDYVDLVRQAARRATVLAYAAEVLIVPAALGSAAPLLGAAALVHRPEMLDPTRVGPRRLVSTT